MAELKSLYVPSSNIKGGSYFIEASLVAQEKDAGGYYLRTASVTIDGTAYNAFESTTVLGNDGLLSVWDKIGFLVNKDKVVMRAGSVIFRVTTSGIEKSTNGGSSWSQM